MSMKIEWIDYHRSPRARPNPDYPQGIDLDLSGGAAKSCFTALPYPAQRVGVYIVECRNCGMITMVTTAGRPDDPRSVKLACKTAPH